MKWETPFSAAVSQRLPLATQMPREAECTAGTRSQTIRTPLEQVMISMSFLLVTCAGEYQRGARRAPLRLKNQLT